jgi:hypothetical protein
MPYKTPSDSAPAPASAPCVGTNDRIRAQMRAMREMREWQSASQFACVLAQRTAECGYLVAHACAECHACVSAWSSNAERRRDTHENGDGARVAAPRHLLQPAHKLALHRLAHPRLRHVTRVSACAERMPRGTNSARKSAQNVPRLRRPASR